MNNTNQISDGMELIVFGLSRQHFGKLKELYRLLSVALVTFPRRVEKPLQIQGYDLEPGTQMMGCIYLLHHREDLYPDSNTFRPERFIERNYSPYEFLPFGGEVRRCVGAALAMYEMTLILSTILNECDLELLETQEVKPVRRGGTLAPKGGIRMCKVGERSALRSSASLSHQVSVRPVAPTAI